MDGLVPMTVHSRSGETEALGIIEKVSYDVQGNDVIVTYTDGMAKGMGMRYTMTGPDTARTELGTLRRIK
jgi:arginyl-tRNA--protein-N-Asp/Glu arginylyltransferase